MEPIIHTTTLAEIVQVYEGLGVDKGDIWFVLNHYSTGYLSVSRYYDRPSYTKLCESNFLADPSMFILNIDPFGLINDNNWELDNPNPLIKNIKIRETVEDKFLIPYLPPTRLLEREHTIIFHTPFSYTLPPFYTTLEEAVVGSLLMEG